MDLEKYKKSWENQPVETNPVSNIDIYKMSHSKSSSIVKWIFIIGVMELSLGICLNFFIPDSYIEIYNDFNLISFLNYYMILSYIIVVLFLFLFYKNYKAVSTIENTKKLMSKILRVRKTVKYYVYFNLIGAAILMITINSIMFSNEELLIKNFNPENLKVDISTLMTAAIIAQIAGALIILIIILLFYRVTYGRLLKKLNQNYKELDNLEHLH